MITKSKKTKNGKTLFIRKSIGMKLTAVLILSIVTALLAVTLINLFFLTPFYKANKEKKLVEVYERLSEMSSQDNDFTSELMGVAIKDNIEITLTDSDFSPLISTAHDAGWTASRLFGYFTNLYPDKVHIVRKTDQYTIQETSDNRLKTSYLEMWGQLDNGDYFLTQTPLESIQTAANLSARFTIGIGLIVILISSVLVYFIMRRMTRPIVELNELSKKMAGLDFNQRYKGQTEDEVGQLGESFNKMSDELESTISELKTANIELQKDNERKTQVDEVRREFLNNVTHELKTPIALIQGYAEGLKDNVASDPDSRDFYCEVIIDESAKMNSMVKQLLTLNRLEFGNDLVEMERFDLTQLIDGVIRGMQVMIEDAGATVRFPFNEPMYVWGDEFKIEEVVTNYISNACHHVDGDHVIDVSMMKDSRGIVTVTVFNTGNIIPEDSIDRVFEKFYKVDKARTRAYGGSGIGLSIVKAIMEGHHQKFGVKNYRNGVAFYFTMDGNSTPAPSNPE